MTSPQAQITAQLSDLHELATVLAHGAMALADARGGCLNALESLSGLRSTALDPVGSVDLTMTGGLALAVVGASELSTQSLLVGVRASIVGYESADQVLQASTVQAVLALPQAAASAASALVRTRSVGAAAQAAIVVDPQLVDIGLQGLDLLAGQPPTPSGSRRLIATLAHGYADRPATLIPQPAAATSDLNGPPRGVADLIRGVQLRDQHDEGGGAIDVRTLIKHRNDGTVSRAVIVDVTGTTRWNAVPGQQTPQVSDFSTNLRALSDVPSSYERGVIAALRASGVSGTDPVMLVGHSQGGLVAARVASSLSATGEFNVTHVVTAGTPLGLSSIPDSVSVLALENRGDVVVHLDGANNPHGSNWVTEQVLHGDMSVQGKHSLSSYVAGGIDIDGREAPALSHWRAAARTFFDADEVHTQAFQLRRS